MSDAPPVPPRPMRQIAAAYAGAACDAQRRAQIAASGVRVLAFDGGGVKGLSEALLVAALETRLGGYRLCECVDAVAGTSTGAIVGSALVYQHMSGDELVRFYRQLCAELFDVSLGVKLRSLFASGGEYSYRLIEQTAAAYFGDARMDAVAWPKCAIPATRVDGASATPALFVSYPTAASCKRAYAHADKRIADAVRASCALPFGFKDADVAGEHFVDGGAWANNPACLMCRDALKVFCDAETGAPPAIDFVLSIGCGRSPRSAEAGPINSRPSNAEKHGPSVNASRVLKGITDVEAPLNELRDEFGLRDRDKLFRLNVTYRQKVGVTSYALMDAIERDTLAWIGENSELLDEIAARLLSGGVRHRNPPSAADMAADAELDALASEFET